MEFETSTIDLSLRNAKTGRPLTANVYDVTFDNGVVRTMSVGQLIMALCLERATEMEWDVVELMEEMAGTTATIESLSTIESRIVETLSDGTEFSLDDIAGPFTITYEDPDTGERVTTVESNAARVFDRLGIDKSGDAETSIEFIESKLDQLNTNSQEQMILLQSQTNKRDQSFELISNVEKSLFTVLSGVANNM